MDNIPEEHKNNPDAPFNLSNDTDIDILDGIVEDDYTVDDAYDDGLLE